MPGPAFDDRQHFVLFHDEVILPIELDFLAGILTEEDRVAGCDVQGNALAIVLGLAASGRDDFALLGFFLRRVGNDDSPDLLFAFFKALDDDAVVERSDIHGFELQTILNVPDSG